MIKQHFVRGFERGARRDHTPKIGLKRGVCQVIFETEDSRYDSRNLSSVAQEFAESATSNSVTVTRVRAATVATFAAAEQFCNLCGTGTRWIHLARLQEASDGGKTYVTAPGRAFQV